MDHPLALLIERYGETQGLYLFGEWSALRTLGPDVYLNRHSPLKVASLEAQLAPLDLWPFPSAFRLNTDAPEVLHEMDNQVQTHVSLPDDTWESALLPLQQAPLVWVTGVDLFDQESRWAEQVQAPRGSWFERKRMQLSSHWGFVFPSLDIRLNPQLPTHSYRLEVWDEVVAEGEAYPGLDCVLAPGDTELPPAPYPWARDPVGQGWMLWMPVGPASTPPVGLERIHWLTQVERHVSNVVNRIPERLLLEDAVCALLMESRRAGYEHELERYVSVAELWRVFRRLLAQGLPLRPLPFILEAMLQAVLHDLARRSITPADFERLGRRLPLFPTEQLVNHVRQALDLPPSS